MNKFLMAIAICAALAACQKEEAAAEAAAGPEAAAAEVAENAPAADGTMAADTEEAASNEEVAAEEGEATADEAVADIPAECQAFVERAEACFEKVGPQAAGMFKQGFDAAREQWATIDDSAVLVQACNAANDQFTPTAAALSCE